MVTRFKNRSMYQLVMLVSVIVMISLLVFSVIGGFLYGYNAVGEALVNLPTGRPIEFPQPEIFFISAKPVTWLFVSIVAFWFSLLETYKDRIRRFTPGQLSFLKLVAFSVAAVAAYEVLYNFTIWGALMAYQSITGELNPDVLVNRFPNPATPWNLVFATKMFMALVMISAYSLYFLTRILTPAEKSHV